MKINLLASAFLLGASATFSVSTVHAQDLLVNSGFEADNGDLNPDSNNLGAVPTGWTVTGGDGNLDTGSGAIAPYDGPYSGGSDGSSGGTTIFDGTGSTQPDGGVTLSQAFSLSLAGDLSGTFSIGDRDGQGATHEALFSIVSTDEGNNFSFSSQGTSPVQGTFTTYNFDAGMVPAGNYVVSFDLPDTDNVDAVAFGLGVGVPEPSTWAMLAVGAGLVGVTLRRRSAARA